MGLAGIIVSLLLLMYLAYREINVIVLAPALAMVAVAAAGDVPILASYTQIFMSALGDYVISFFPLFLLGAIFGKIMADSGAARAIAERIISRLGPQRAILAVVLSCAVITYGGVSLFVVAFAVYPIASALFRRADIPKRLLPATIALGAFTFTMSAFPGTPAIQNAIPMPFFGTNVFAAPLLGLFAGAIMLVGGTMWLERRAAGARLSGEGYGTHPATAADSAPREDDALPPFGLAVLPVVAVIVLNALLTWVVFPRMQTDYLSLPLYGSTDLQSVAGLWAIILSLILSTLLAVALNWKRFADLRKSLNAGTIGSLEPIMNTASVVGYGAVIAALPAFLVLRDSVLDLFPGNAQASLAVAVMTLSGITGSASGGMSIALQALGTEFAQMAQAQGISMEVMHRITALAGGSFDVLPHNGAVITLLAITGMTHRKAYGDIFVVGIVIPVIALLLALLVSTLF